MLTVIVLGTSGGPFEANTQSFLVKQNDRSYVSVDCGCGLSSISKLFMKNQQYSEDLDLYNNWISTKKTRFNVGNEIVKSLSHPNINITFQEPDNVPGENVIIKSANFYSFIKKYFITHPHMDHISGMILNSPLAFDPYFLSSYKDTENIKDENISPISKVFYGFESTIRPIETHIFNCEIWPDLLFKNESILKTSIVKPYSTIHVPEVGTTTIKSQGNGNTRQGDFDIIPFPLLHGTNVRNPEQVVTSSAYYINKKVPENESLIIFGDCESEDEYLFKIWDFLSDSIVYDNVHLKGVFIECSTMNLPNVGTDQMDKAKLYGHFIPYILCKELKKFKSLIDLKFLENKNKETKLKKKIHHHHHHHNMAHIAQPINIFITHVKQIVGKNDPRILILQQLRQHAIEENIDDFFTFSIALNGHTYKL